MNCAKGKDYSIEKMVKSSWRKVNTVKPTSIREAIETAQTL